MDVEEKKLLKRLAKAKESGKLDDWETYCRRLAEYRVSLGNYEGALEAYREELSVCEQKGDLKSVAGSHRMIGEMCSTLGLFQESLCHVNKYLRYAKVSQDNIEEQRALATLGRTYFCWAVELQQNVSSDKDKVKLSELLKECRKAYMKSLYICEQELRGVGNRERQEMKARLLFNLGLACEIEEELDEALNYIARAIVICKQDSLLEDLHRCYINQSNIFLKLGNSSAALVAADKAVEVAKKLSNSVELTVLALITKGDIYFEMSNYPGARATLKKAHKLKTPNVDDKKTVEINLCRAAFLCQIEDRLIKLPKDNFMERKELYEKMGDACCAVKNFKHAIQSYLRMLECGQNLGQTEKELQSCYVSLYQTYRDNKQYELALTYAKKELDIIKNVPREAARSHIVIGEILEFKKATYFEISEEYMSALDCARSANIISLQASALRRLVAVQKAYGYIDLAQESEKELASLNVEESGDSDSELEDSPTFGIHLSDISDSDEESNRQRATRNTFKVTRNEKGETPLHVAAIRGDVERAKRLLSLGHPVRERDLAGWTPLHEAANHGHLDMVKFLVDSGADMNDCGGKDCGGVTPLHDSASCGHFSIISYLLDKGASVAALTDSGETPLDCLRGWRERVEDLDIASQDEYKILERRLDEALKSTGLTNCRILVTQKKRNSENKLVRDRRSSPKNSLRRVGGWEKSTNRWCPASPEVDRTDSETISIIDSPPQRIVGSPQKRALTRQPVADYCATINALRQRLEVKDISNPKPKVAAPLLNEDDFVDDWLDDDIGNERKSKRKIVDLVEKRGVSERRNLCNLEQTALHDVSVPALLNNEPMRKKARTAQYVSEHFPIRKSPPPPVVPPSDELFDFPTIPSPPMSSVSDRAVKVKIRIKICNHILLIAVNNMREDLTVRWLAEEAAKRYRDLEGSEPQLMLKTKDGAIISLSDPLNIVFDEEIEASVLGWIIPPLPDRYRDACRAHTYNSGVGYGGHGILPDTAVLSRLEECTTSQCLNLNNYCLTSEELKPVLVALKHEKTLHTLDLSGNMIDDGGIDLLSQCLETCTIEHLRLRGTNISAKSLDRLCNHLSKSNPSLLLSMKRLDVSYNPLGDTANSSLENIKSLFPTLETLLTEDIDFP